MNERGSDLLDLLSEATRTPVPYVRTFEEAVATPDTWCVMETDYGGQINMTFPMKDVKCSELTLRRLVSYLAWTTWGPGVDLDTYEPLSSPASMAEELDHGDNYYFIRGRVGDGVPGGCGGGELHAGIWLHQDALDEGLTPEMIEKVLSGNENEPLPAMEKWENILPAR